jgi:hypothetical protein
MTEASHYNDQIHEVITLDGIKVGSLNTTRLHKDGNETELEKDFTLNKQELLNSGWKLQQDLPTKGVHDTDTGSQIQKNVFQGLSFNLDKMFHYKGEDITGSQLIDKINNIVGQLSNKGVKQLYKELGIDENGKINNVSLFYDSLANQLIEQEGNKNIINGLKAQINPVGIPQAYGKIMNMFASIVLDRVVKIKTNGGSFIQMSDFGLNKTEANEKGVLWTPWSENKVQPYTVQKDGIGNILKGPNGKPLIRPAGILIPGSLIAQHIPNYRDYTNKPEILFGTLNPETNEYEGGLIDYKILNNIIGYRIPNQGISSNDAFQIAGILPEGMGDTIVAYTGITTKTGSDYDIDKMYMMIPSFNKVDGKLVYKDSLENDLIEAYKAVFTSPDVLNDLMTPIDFDFIKNDILAFNKEDETSDTYHFDGLKDIYIKAQYKAGKAGVGMEANSLVDHVRGTMANLRFNGYYLGVGFKNELGETKFDEEFSEELSDEDLKLYSKKYNELSDSKISASDLESLKKIKIANSLSAIIKSWSTSISSKCFLKTTNS